MPRADPSSVTEPRHERDRIVRLRAAAGGPLAVAAVEIIARAARDWTRAPQEIAQALRQTRHLSSAERRLLAEAIYGWVRSRRRLAWIARSEAIPVTLQVWFAEHAASDDEAVAAGGAFAPEIVQALGRVGVDSQRVATADACIASEISLPAEQMAVRLSYPTWLVERLHAIHGVAQTERLLVAMNQRAPLTVRANRLRIDRETLAQRLATLGITTCPTRLATDGLVLETHRNVYGLAPFREGLMELQDEGSQLIAQAVAPPPRSLVVDACAGAGGKTLALGVALDNRGRLFACDVNAPRLAELRVRVRRAGLTNVVVEPVTAAGPTARLRKRAARADRVLVDAPCSGLGVIRRNPETKWRVAPRDLSELAAKQGDLLDRYAELVGVGGRLIYATCSILPEENDDVVAAFLARQPNFEPVPLKEIFGSARAAAIGDGERLRLRPDSHDTDGFFAAVLRRHR